MACWFGAMAAGNGQALSGLMTSAVDIGEAPPTGVRDSAGVFHRNAALLQKITGQLQQLKEQHNFQIYLVLESVLVTQNVQVLATEMQQAWIPDGNGIVLVFEMDSKSLGFGQRYGEDLKKDLPPGQVPSYEMMQVLSKVAGGVDRLAPPEVFLDSLITNLVRGYNDYFIRREQPVPEGRTLRLMLIFIGGVAALALVGLAAAWMMKRAEKGVAGQAHHFPDADAVERLGAPYGGGKVSSRRFGKDGAGRS